MSGTSSWVKKRYSTKRNTAVLNVLINYLWFLSHDNETMSLFTCLLKKFTNEGTLTCLGQCWLSNWRLSLFISFALHLTSFASLSNFIRALFRSFTKNGTKNRGISEVSLSGTMRPLTSRTTFRSQSERRAGCVLWSMSTRWRRGAEMEAAAATDRTVDR